MAPHPLFPKLEAAVLVDGRPVKEHADREDANSESKVVYIEAEAGEQFGVRFFIPGYVFDRHSIKVIVNIDGVDMRKFIFERHKYDLYGITRQVNDSSALIGHKYLGQRFRFADLNTHDDNYEIDHALWKQLKWTGNISITFHRVTNVRFARAWKDVPSMREYDEVPEKALKGSSVSHKTTLDPLHRIAPVTFMEADYVDNPSRPLAEIEFRYRSKEALKYLSIIPRIPSPEPFKEDLSEEKVQKIYLKHEETQSRKRDHPGDDHDYEDVEMVEERPAKRRCFPTSTDEVISLD
ncbi:hypothetical protein J4E90_001627 [Alternaria incomplexa]|uniref:uncharacterized protein n=1 Tax=Alternaria incomplexa TaxID=1187928 RepID=UPI00221E46B0|nr:uncharacterized protein J4E90_001627 [Alternaria incomplexa]KAI4919492.1 hypothetical protein J4E90_001627 [Alternaria incomplexa]